MPQEQTIVGEGPELRVIFSLALNYLVCGLSVSMSRPVPWIPQMLRMALVGNPLNPHTSFSQRMKRILKQSCKCDTSDTHL